MFSNSQNRSAVAENDVCSEQKEKNRKVNFELQTKLLSVDKKCTITNPQEALYLTVKDETTPKMGVLHTMFGVNSTEEFKLMIAEVYKLADKFDNPVLLGEYESFIAIDKDNCNIRRTEECATFIFKAAVAGKLDLEPRFKRLLVQLSEQLAWVRVKEVKTFEQTKIKLSFNNSSLSNLRYIHLWASLIINHISFKRQGLELDGTKLLLKDLFKATQNTKIKSKRRQPILLKSKLSSVFSTKQDIETKYFSIFWPPVAGEQEQHEDAILEETTQEQDTRYQEEHELSIEDEESEEVENKVFVSKANIVLPCDRSGYLLTEMEQTEMEKADNGYDVCDPERLQAKTFVISKEEDSLEMFRLLEEEIDYKIGLLPSEEQEGFIEKKELITNEFNSLLTLRKEVCPEKPAGLHACCKSLEQLLLQINEYLPVRDYTQSQLEEDLINQEIALREEQQEISNNLHRIDRLKQELEANKAAIQNAQKEITGLQNLDEQNSLEDELINLAFQKQELEREIIALAEKQLSLDEAILTVQEQKNSLYATNKELKSELAEQQAQQVYNENNLKQKLADLEQENQRLKETLSSLQDNTQAKVFLTSGVTAMPNSGSGITIDEDTILAFNNVASRAPCPLPSKTVPVNRFDPYKDAVLNFIPLGGADQLDEEAHLYNSTHENESTTTLASSVSTVCDPMEKRSITRGATYAKPAKHASSQAKIAQHPSRTSNRTRAKDQRRDSFSSVDEEALVEAVRNAQIREQKEASNTALTTYVRNETPTHDIEWISSYFQTEPHSMSTVKFWQTKWKMSRLKAKVKKYRKKNKLDKLEKANKKLREVMKYLAIEQSLMYEKEKAMNSFVEQKKHMYLAEKKQFKELNMNLVKKKSQLSGSYFDLQNELLKEQAYELQRQQLQELQRQKSLSTFNLAERDMQPIRTVMSRSTSVKSLLEKQPQQTQQSEKTDTVNPQKDQQTYTIVEERALEQQYTQTAPVTFREGEYEHAVQLQKQENRFFSPTDVVNSMPLAPLSNSIDINNRNSLCDKREASLIL